MGSGNTSNPATIKRPANTKVGDLLIVGLMFEKGEAPSVTPLDKDWVRIQRVNQENQLAIVTFYKIVKANNEPENYQFRIKQAPKWTMGISRISGADVEHPDGPIVTFTGATGPQGLIGTAPSLTTIDCNTMVMLFYSNKKNSTWTGPAGTIEVYDDPNDQQGLTSNMMSYFIQSEPGETGDLSATASESEHWASQAIAIRPKASNFENARINPLLGETVTEIVISEGMTNLQREETSSHLIAYPNPVKDKLNLDLKGLVLEEPTDYSLVILDAMGRIQHMPKTWYENESRLELDFSQMHMGLYVIHVNTVKGIKTVNVIKDH